MRRVFFTLLLLFALTAHASLWIENVPKKGLLVQGGDFPKAQAQQIEDADVYVMDMQNTLLQGAVNGSKISVDMPQIGSYYVYLQSRQVIDDVLHVTLLKTRIYNREADLSKSLLKEIRGKSMTHYDIKPCDRVAMDMSMLRPIKNHHINCCLYSGDIARFKLYFKGALHQDIALHVSTEQGWSKRVYADKEGIVSFEIPRDHYVDTFTKKRASEALLIEANYESDEAGSYNNMPYHKTHYYLSERFSFHTAPLEYSSKVPAYLTVVGVMIAFSLGLFYLRRRRRREHKDIWFEEN